MCAQVILVTGATGFIGRALCGRLHREGTVVKGFARHSAEGPWDELLMRDLTQSGALQAALAGVDTVFHLAARTHSVAELNEDETEYRRINVEGTRSLLREAEQQKVSGLVFLSSVKSRGEGGDQCIDENWDLRPDTVYGRTKLEAERLVLEAGRRHGFHACVLRLPLVYGPGVKGNLRRMIEAIDRGRFPPLPDTGNKRSLVHVDDVVQAALLAAENPRANGQTYIVTDEQAYSTRQIYELICRALGKRVPRWAIPETVLRLRARVGDMVGRVRGRHLVFDSAALRKLLGSAWYSCEKIRELGYRPTRTLADAVGEMVAVYRRG